MNPAVIKEIAPHGTLRASINLGNPVLASRADAQGDPRGVSVDLARALAGRLGVALEALVFGNAGQSVAAVARGEADIGFFALDPARVAQLRFAPPYALIQGACLVREASPLRCFADVDQAGLRVVVSEDSACDLVLTRALQRATIERAPSSPAVVDAFLRGQADVAAGVRQQLEADCQRRPGLRMLAGDFMTIEQAIGMPASRSEEAMAVVHRFVEDMKADGFVARALKRHGIAGARVSPPAP